MIDFSKIRARHYPNSIHDDNEGNGVNECSACKTGVWPCEVIEVLDDFELFIKKIKFNIQIIDSWIDDYPIKNGNSCKRCGHPFQDHGKFGCDVDHEGPDWVEKGCTCPSYVE